MSIIGRSLSTAAALLAVAACTSATKRYEQGQAFEREGRPADAADRYIQALRKDARLESARIGLRAAGAAAIAKDLRSVDNADRTTVDGADAAADAVVAIDDLHRRALDVGVDLAFPLDYPDQRRATLDNAIALNRASALELASRERFDMALERLRRASQR